MLYIPLNDDLNGITHTKFYFIYHRLELSTMTPLSIEKLSVGSPLMFHARILIGSPRILLNEKSCEQGIPKSYTKGNKKVLTGLFKVR